MLRLWFKSEGETVRWLCGWIGRCIGKGERERERESEQGLRGKKEKEMGSEWVVGKMGYGFFFFF